MQAPLWNGKRIATVSPEVIKRYLHGLGFAAERQAEHNGLAIFEIYSKGDAEVWAPIFSDGSDYMLRVCTFINNIALIEGIAQSDVYEALTIGK